MTDSIVSLEKGEGGKWEVRFDGVTTCWDLDLEHAAVMALTYRAVLKLEREVILGPGVPENALELGYRLASALDFYRNRAKRR